MGIFRLGGYLWLALGSVGADSKSRNTVGLEIARARGCLATSRGNSHWAIRLAGSQGVDASALASAPGPRRITRLDWQPCRS